MLDRFEIKKVIVNELGKLDRFSSKSIFVLDWLLNFPKRFDELLDLCNFSLSLDYCKVTYFYIVVGKVEEILNKSVDDSFTFTHAVEAYNYIDKGLNLLKDGVSPKDEDKIFIYSSEFGSEIRELACSGDVGLNILLVSMAYCYDFLNATRYITFNLDIDDKSKFKVLKVKEFSMTFKYGNDVFLIHEDTEEGRSLTLYRKYKTERGFVLQPIASKTGVNMSDLKFGRFNPYLDGVTYSCIDKDRLILSMTYLGLVCSYCSKRAHDLRRRNKEREQQIQVLEDLVRSLRSDIANLKE